MKIPNKKLGKMFLVLFVAGFGLSYFLIKNKNFFDKSSAPDLKVGFVADWEYHWSQVEDEKATSSAGEHLLKIVKHFNSSFQPDLVVGGGDYIFGASLEKEVAQKQLKEVISIFNKIKAEKLFCLGSRDTNKISKNELLKLLNSKSSYLAKEIKGYKVIILDTTEVEGKEGLGKGVIGPKQKEWLKKELETELPVLIFSHHSIIETPAGEIWRENLINGEDVFSIIKEKKEKVLVVFSGNVEEDFAAKEEGIPFVSIAGLTREGSLGRFAEIIVSRLKEGEFVVKINNYGQNGTSFEIRRNLHSDSATKILTTRKKGEEKVSETNYWKDIGDNNNKNGIISANEAGEVNIGVTALGNIVTAFEDESVGDRIRVKIYKDGKWENLSDKDHPDGLISLGDAGNPTIATKGEDVFVTFTEYDFGYKARLLMWSDGKWQEISPGGFVSETRGHEPVLSFDKEKKYLYLAYAEGIAGDDINNSNPEEKKTKIKVKKWNGSNWESVASPGNQFASEGIAFEVDLEPSQIDDSMYIAFEELVGEKHQIKIKKWEEGAWVDLGKGDFFEKTIKNLNGFSPSIAVGRKDHLFLTFIENYEGPNWAITYDGKEWLPMGSGKISNNKTKEPLILATEDGKIFSSYSEYRKNIVTKKTTQKPDGKEKIKFSKTNAWKVRVKKWDQKAWKDCEGAFNVNGYISKGRGKGDPAMVSYGDFIYVIFSDEENGYAARVRGYKYK